MNCDDFRERHTYICIYLIYMRIVVWMYIHNKHLQIVVWISNGNHCLSNLLVLAGVEPPREGLQWGDTYSGQHAWLCGLACDGSPRRRCLYAQTVRTLTKRRDPRARGRCQESRHPGSTEPAPAELLPGDMPFAQSRRTLARSPMLVVGARPTAPLWSA